MRGGATPAHGLCRTLRGRALENTDRAEVLDHTDTVIADAAALIALSQLAVLASSLAARPASQDLAGRGRALLRGAAYMFQGPVLTFSSVSVGVHHRRGSSNRCAALYSA